MLKFCPFFFLSKKHFSFFFVKKFQEKNISLSDNIFCGGNGNGNGSIKNQNMFSEGQPDKFYCSSYIPFSSKKQNSSFFLVFMNKIQFFKQKKKKEVVVKNCELIPTLFLCKLLEELFGQKLLEKSNLNKVKNIINNWYIEENYRFAEIKKIEILENDDKVLYYFDLNEPKIKSFTILIEEKKSKRENSFVKNLQTYLFSKLLGLSFGNFFKLDPLSWNHIRSSNEIDLSDFSIKDNNLGDFGNFIDITIKIKKKQSLAVEPEIVLMEGQISSSIGVVEKNLLGTGMAIKQKIFFKRLRPHYVKLEINDRALEKLQNFWILGKYYKNLFVLNFSFKKFQSKSRNVYLKLSSESKISFQKASSNQGFSRASFKSSLVLGNTHLFKSHSCFGYFSIDNSTKILKTKGLIGLNSIFKSSTEKIGIIGLFESRYNSSKSLKKSSSKAYIENKNLRFLTNKINQKPTIPIEKTVSLNTILPRDLKMFINMVCITENKYIYNIRKKLELKIEMGNLFSFSWNLSNSGKTKIIIN